MLLSADHVLRTVVLYPPAAIALPRLRQRPRFRRATDDGLLLMIEAADKSFNLTSVKELPAGGATAVEEIWSGGGPPGS